MLQHASPESRAYFTKVIWMIPCSEGRFRHGARAPQQSSSKHDEICAGTREVAAIAKSWLLQLLRLAAPVLQGLLCW